jgi:hypothetical protein
MKVLMLMSMFLMVGCLGGSGGSGGGDSDGGNYIHQDLVITFDSMGFYTNSGWSAHQYSVNEQRSLIIPEFVELLSDTNNSLQINDIARIKFATSDCDYRFNGTRFNFHSCSGHLVGAQYGDVIYLYDVREPMNPGMNGKVNFGVFKGGAGHTGTIVIRTNLQ